MTADPTVPLTEEQRARWEFVQGSQTALMSVLFDGEPTAAICAVTRNGDAYDVTPLYVALTDATFARCTPPNGAKEF